MNKILTIFLLTLTMGTTGVLTQAASEDEKQRELDMAADEYNKKKTNDKYKVVCKREAPVGSRIKKKVCRTVAVMENTRKEAQRSIQKMRTSVGQPNN